jgi:hypothetical protein
MQNAATAINNLPAELRAGPPAVVSVLSLFGYTLDVWIQLLTLLWLVLLIAGWIWDRFFRKPAPTAPLEMNDDA